jgi:uncharacterized protein YjcR
MAKKSSKKDGGQRYDWDLIMNDYVCHRKMSLRDIAQKYGIPLCTVAKKSKADNWFATKQEYREESITEVRTKVRTEQTDDLAGLVRASDYIEKAILKAINDPDYFNKHLVSRNLNEEEDTLTILNTKAMKDMMRVIKDVEDVKRSILDIKKSDVSERLAIERERLELEKERLALERERIALRNGNIDDENNYGVVLLPERMKDE